jgi:hypothetical protein
MTQDHREDPAAVSERPKLRGSLAARALDTRHFAYFEFGAKRVERQLGFELESGRGKRKHVDVSPPERAVPITEVGEPRPIQEIDQDHEPEVAGPPQRREVGRSAARHRP